MGDGTNGDSGNIGTNGDHDDPLETRMVLWLYNGGNVDTTANGDNDFDGDSGNIGTIGDNGDDSHHWRQ